MKKFFSVLLVVIAYFQFSCYQDATKKIPIENKAETVLNKDFTTDWNSLTTDFMTWYNYTFANIHLSQDFIGLNIDSVKIDKTTFLNKLMTGNVVAFQIKILQGEPVYKLFKLNTNDESIKATVKQMASTEMAHFKMEGTKIPEFNFTDLNGKTYDNPSTKEKIIVVKCWFIHCVACVKEFPALNKLVGENKDRNDLLFISLAMDSKQDLINFLKTKEFNYAVIPEMEHFMVDKLAITAYPTHILIDKSGKIVKIVNRIDDLIPFLKKELQKTKI